MKAANRDTVNALLHRGDLGFKRYKDITESSKNVTEWLNTDEASAILATGDFYFREMYNLPGFPKEEMLSQLHWWMMRNKGMCENVVRLARAKKARRVVVVVGANHKKYMEQLFGSMPGATVRSPGAL